MSIRKRITKQSTIYYEASLWFKGNLIKSKTFARKVDAEEWKLRERKKLLDSSVGRLRGRSVSFKEFYEKEFRERKSLRPGTRLDYDAMYRKYIANSVGERRLEEISDDHWAALLNDLKKNLSAARINRIRTFLSSVYSLALKLKYVSTNPILLIESFEEPLAKTEYWSEDEARRFLSWASENSKLFPLYHLVYETGLRRGEALGLKRESIDIDAGAIVIRSVCSYHSKGIVESTKGGKSRPIGISPHLKARTGYVNFVPAALREIQGIYFPR